MLAFTLKSDGHQVDEASDGQEGLDKFKSASCAISLFIIDQVMPRMDGLTLTKSLRALGVKTPILLLTTEPSPAVKAAAKAAGASGLFVKPFDPQKLKDLVDRTIR